ncbi:hypothetical protein PIB30_021609, partial [Stylosanthes scabra]|nr:hypothetical protein [Stylosanthes scabra]
MYTDGLAVASPLLPQTSVFLSSLTLRRPVTLSLRFLPPRPPFGVPSPPLYSGTELAEAAAGAACGWGSFEFVQFRRCPYLSRHYAFLLSIEAAQKNNKVRGKDKKGSKVATLMSFGGFLENKQGGGGARIVPEIPYTNGSSNHHHHMEAAAAATIMASGAISHPHLAKSMFNNSPALSLAL